MLLRRASLGVLWSVLAYAEVPAQIDFKRDVQPILKEHCTGCHGAAQQMGRFRLDRRKDAMRGGSIAVIAPGTASGSRLYHKITSTRYGTQMPPTGPLNAEKIEIIKRWLDQGALWPDDVSGDVAGPPPDRVATQIMEAIRSGEFRKLSAGQREAVNRKGPGGSTPLMYAALYGDAAAVQLLLKAGADPNIRNHADATALMWAVADAGKTKLLLDAGADVNAKSGDGRTALSIAAGRAGAAPLVKLLLDRGAKPSVSERPPLNEAAMNGDEEIIRVLLESEGTKSTGLVSAIRVRCDGCTERLIKAAKPNELSTAMVAFAVNGEASRFQSLLTQGVAFPPKDPQGITPLMQVVARDNASPEIVQTLIDRGGEINAKSIAGRTALDFAVRHGDTGVVGVLKKAGAEQAKAPANPAAQPKPAASVRAALDRTLPLLLHADDVFLRQSGCVSCHHNSLTSMTLALAQKNGIKVSETAAERQRKSIGPYLESWRERALQGIGIPGNQDTVSYLLIGLGAVHYPADAATDALAYYLRSRQRPDGSWLMQSHRPPMESSEIEVTAAGLRSLQLYAPKTAKAEYERAVASAARWLASARPVNTEDRAFQLLGLAWAGGDRSVIAAAGKALLADQRPDGGWAQLPSLPSDAYATGQAMVALQQSGVLSASASPYQKAVRFLLNTQFEDGSWFVRSRAVPFQPYFETGFPFGDDQWISAAGTNWAAMGLAYAAR